MTNPTGLSFLSYRRKRSEEAAKLVQAQHDHGIPTWQDISDLVHEPTAAAIRKVLQDENIANGLVWLTPDVTGSEIIPKIEIPGLIRRSTEGDNFFLVPVAAGGLDYSDAESIAKDQTGLQDLGGWNLLKIASNPADEGDIIKVVQVVLSERLKAIDQMLTPDQPFTMSVNVLSRPPRLSNKSLSIDWTEHFTNRWGTSAAWPGLIAALTNIRATIQLQNPGRPIHASGRPTLSMAVLFGATFIRTSGLRVGWLQQNVATGSEELWQISDDPVDINLDCATYEMDLSSYDQAIGVGLGHDIGSAIKQSLQAGTIPPLRGAIVLRPHSIDNRGLLNGSGEAVAVAEQTLGAIRRARELWGSPRTLHLFIAGPVGVAMMVGQLLNTVGPVQTYEYDPAELGIYRPSIRLTPNY